MNGTVESPCIGVCQLDAASVCTGCGRTIHEIAGWSQASLVTRQAIVANAAARRAQRAAESPEQER